MALLVYSKKKIYRHKPSTDDRINALRAQLGMNLKERVMADKEFRIRTDMKWIKLNTKSDN